MHIYLGCGGPSYLDHTDTHLGIYPAGIDTKHLREVITVKSLCLPFEPAKGCRGCYLDDPFLWGECIELISDLCSLRISQPEQLLARDDVSGYETTKVSPSAHNCPIQHIEHHTTPLTVEMFAFATPFTEPRVALETPLTAPANPPAAGAI